MNRLTWIGFSVLAALSGLVLIFSAAPAPVYAQTPVPTGTPIAPGIISNTGTLTGLLNLPPPYDIPPITDTIALTELWSIDNLTGVYRTVITIPRFQNVGFFLSIIPAFLAIAAGFRVVVNLLKIRNESKRAGADEP